MSPAPTGNGLAGRPGASPDPLGTVFRSDALRRHAQGAAVAVAPRAASPRMLVRMWLLLTLLLVGGGGTAWSVHDRLVVLEHADCAAGRPACTTAQPGSLGHAG